MRKYIAICVGVLFLTFMVAAMAQQSGGYGQSGQSTMGGQSQTGNPTPSGQSSSANAGKTKTVEGCIMKEESDWFLVPKRGNPIRLQASGSENPSAHEGHRVKISGNETSMSAGSMGGTSGGTAGATTENPPAGQSQAGQPGAVASGSNPSAGSSGTASGDLHRLSDKEITVDKIDMVSETCPVNWNSKVKGQGKSGGSTTPPASTPPQF